jgi:hypothetical protein
MTKRSYNITRVSEIKIDKLKDLLNEMGFQQDYRIVYFNEEKELVIENKKLQKLFKRIMEVYNEM